LEKLKTLLSKCKCGVYLEVNKHRDSYESAAEILDDAEGYECPPKIAPEVKQRMIETDTIITLQFYPDTPIGFYEIWHYDLDMVLNEALKCLGNRGRL